MNKYPEKRQTVNMDDSCSPTSASIGSNDTNADMDHSESSDSNCDSESNTDEDDNDFNNDKVALVKVILKQ